MADPVTLAALAGTFSSIGSTVAASAGTIAGTVAANAGTIGAVSSVLGGTAAAVGTVAAGRQAVGAAKNEQSQLNRMAEERMAIASRNKAAANLKTRQTLSRVQAVAAASGGTATDPTVLQIMAGIDKAGALEAAEAWRQGAEEGAMLRYRGKVGVSAAKANRSLSYLNASRQFLSGTGDAFSKYGSGLEAKYGEPDFSRAY